jgi:tetratricopeptide (TPR) repeat protein
MGASHPKMAAQRAGLDELRFLVEALSGFAACGEDVARLVASVLGTKRERFTQKIDRALGDLRIAVGVQVEAPSAPTLGFLARFHELWAGRGEGAGALGREWLEEMDERRYTDAPGVAVEFDRRLEEIEPEQVPLSLGVLGSALRLDFWYTRAEMAIKLGLEFADEVLDHSAAGDLHLRMTMVKWDQGEQAAAFAQNGLAFARYLEARDKAGEARATVDKGGLLIYRAEFSRAVRVFHAALKLLPAAETRNRASTLEGLAHCYAQLGETTKARDHGELALTLPRSRFSLGKAQWTMAAVEFSAGNHGLTLAWLRKAKETLFPVSPVDAALVSIDIMETFVRSKDLFAAKNEARQMLRYIAPLRARTPLAEAAAHGLALAGARAEGLTVATLLVARKEIQAKPNKG